MTNKKISIIIANHNAKDVLQECLKNLYSLKTPLEIIVVDNGSGDGSYEMVKKDFPSVIAVKQENLGISVAYNVGLSKSTGDYLLYLGSDAFPTDEALLGCIKFLEDNSNVGAVTCKLVLRDGTLDMDAHRGIPTPWTAITHFTKLNRIFPKSKIFNQYFLGYKDMAIPHEIGLCISHFLFVRKEVFSVLKKWDEDFFVYGEDVDFCYRLQEADYKLFYLPQYPVKHLKGVSVGIRKETQDITKASIETRKRMKKMSTDAMKLFYKKHFVKKYPSFITSFVLLAITIMEKIRVNKIK